MTSSAPRAPIDFDAFERDLRQATLPAGDSPAPGPKGDPLAELARIVGQDDPFRALLQARQAQGGERASPEGASQRGRVEPSFFEAAPASVSPAEAFDQYLANVEQQGAPAQDDEAHTQAQSAQAHRGQDSAAFEDAPAPAYRNVLAKRPRRQLVQVGAGLGVLVLCVTGALGWKLLRPHGSDGGPVTVLADRTPLKVAPTAADGVEIPDQNKQIYERKAKDGQIRVVNREEQPLDVAQAARAGRDNAGASGPTTPGQTAMLTESLGTPRRVRTVSVKPDTPPASVQREAQREAPPPRETQVASAEPTVGRAPPSPIPTMTMPDSGSAAPDAPSPSRRPSRTLASTNASSSGAASGAAKPASEADASAPPAAAQTADAPTPASRRKASQRVAAVAPEAPAPSEDTQAGASAADASPASTASVGGYSVQLGVRNSEADAQAAFKQMQGKFSQLAGKPALIRHAEVDGRSLYRVRVGPLAKAEASSLCSALKSAGGQCFIAKN